MVRQGSLVLHVWRIDLGVESLDVPRQRVEMEHPPLQAQSLHVFPARIGIAYIIATIFIAKRFSNSGE